MTLPKEDAKKPSEESSDASQSKKEKVTKASEETEAKAADKPADKTSAVKPGMADYLAGESKLQPKDLKPHLPSDLIGGVIPYIAGTEDEAVWNAASQACSTEKVHYCYSIEDDRCWFLACPSSSLASNPDSWCPLAAALPGNSEYWDRETVYLYEQEGLASALRWDNETGRMQVYLGAARTLLPRIQSMDANFVTINPDVADVVPWQNRALRSEKLSRAAANVLLLFGLVVNVIILILLFGQYIITNNVERDLASVKTETEKASTDLMINAFNALQSDTIKHMVRVQELLDGLQKIDGTLVKYEVSKGRAEWEALLPSSFSGCDGVLKGCKIIPGLEKDGRVRVKGNK